MAKTTITNIIAKIKRRSDYNITDSDLDTLILDAINDVVKLMKQMFYEYQLFENITAQTTFYSRYLEHSIDLRQAYISGDGTTFTGAAGMKIKVSVDGTDYDNIDVSACTDIDDVVTAIEAIIAGVAANTNSVLTLTSKVLTSASSVTIAEGSAGTVDCVDQLFTNDYYPRTSTGISDLDEIFTIQERTFKYALQVIPYDSLIELYPDPLSIKAQVPDFYARFNNLLFLGPTPSASICFYIDYVKALSDLTSSDSLPYDQIFDPLVISWAKLMLLQWLDSSNVSLITIAKSEVEDMKKQLITQASRNVKMNRQVQSRRNLIPYFSPRKVTGPQR